MKNKFIARRSAVIYSKKNYTGYANGDDDDDDHFHDDDDDVRPRISLVVALYQQAPEKYVRMECLNKVVLLKCL